MSRLIRLATTVVSMLALHSTAHADVLLDDTPGWLQRLGYSSLNAFGADRTIDFSFNPLGTPTGKDPLTGLFSATGAVAQFTDGPFGFNQTPVSYSQLFTGAESGNITSAVSFEANPWALKISNGALAFDGSAGSGSSAIAMQFWSKSGSCTSCFSEGVKAVSFDLLGYGLAAATSNSPAEQGLLMVTYKNLSTGALRSDYSEVFKTSPGSNAYNIGAVANLGEVIYQLSYFDCFRTFDHQHWLGCSAQAAIDNIRIVQAVPEPPSLALAGIGLGLIAFIARRRRRIVD